VNSGAARREAREKLLEAARRREIDRPALSGKLNADPFSGYLFIFRTRRGSAIRVRQYDGQGVWLATKGYPRVVFGGGPEVAAIDPYPVTNRYPAAAVNVPPPGGWMSTIAWHCVSNSITPPPAARSARPTPAWSPCAGRWELQLVALFKPVQSSRSGCATTYTPYTRASSTAACYVAAGCGRT
jgi:hypothetical protein